jgi:hypothetical protein
MSHGSPAQWSMWKWVTRMRSISSALTWSVYLSRSAWVSLHRGQAISTSREQRSGTTEGTLSPESSLQRKQTFKRTRQQCASDALKNEHGEALLSSRMDETERTLFQSRGSSVASASSQDSTRCIINRQSWRWPTHGNESRPFFAGWTPQSSMMVFPLNLRMWHDRPTSCPAPLQRADHTSTARRVRRQHNETESTAGDGGHASGWARVAMRAVEVSDEVSFALQWWPVALQMQREATASSHVQGHVQIGEG